MSSVKSVENYNTPKNQGKGRKKNQCEGYSDVKSLIYMYIMYVGRTKNLLIYPIVFKIEFYSYHKCL